MRRTVTFLAVAIALAAGIWAMAEATQNRPDVEQHGTVSTVEFTVSTRGYQRGEPAAATALWAVCSSTVGGEVSAVPEPVGSAWQVTVTPAIGEHGRKRLIGCLEDLTIDRVVGEVRHVRSGG